MPDPTPNTCPGGVSPLDTLARLIELYDGCARAGILSDLGRLDRANLERLRRVWAALPDPETLTYLADNTTPPTHDPATGLGFLCLRQQLRSLARAIGTGGGEAK